MTNVMITGASSGIGLELTKIYLELGAKVIAVCRKSTEELQQLDLKVIEGIDFTQNDFAKKVINDLGDIKLDLIINNAGVLYNETLNEFDIEHIRQQLEINALAPIILSQALIPHMARPSKMIFITSRMGSIADNTSGAYYGYRASKCALNAFVTSLTIDLKNHQIATALLHPGYVKTKMTNFNGDVTPKQSATMLFQRICEVNPSNSGQFRHANGASLDW